MNLGENENDVFDEEKRQNLIKKRKRRITDRISILEENNENSS